MLWNPVGVVLLVQYMVPSSVPTGVGTACTQYGYLGTYISEASISGAALLQQESQEAREVLLFGEEDCWNPGKTWGEVCIDYCTIAASNVPGCPGVSKGLAVIPSAIIHT